MDFPVIPLFYLSHTVKICLFYSLLYASLIFSVCPVSHHSHVYVIEYEDDF